MTKQKSDRFNISWYDIPRYYDIAMQDEGDGEVAFIKSVIEKFNLTSNLKTKGCKILEPACGTGRLIAPLVKAGHHVTALDLSPAMVNYSREQLVRGMGILPMKNKNSNHLARKLSASILVADMTDFRLKDKVDLGVCLLDSFRHLTTEEAAVSHLQSMARAIRRGGIYLLGLHLLPMDASLECTERWTQERKGTKVTTTFRVTSASRRERIENIRVSTLVREKGKELRFRDEFPLRIYTASQLKSLIAKVPEWRIESVHDYWYELDYAMKLDDEMSDTVLILRRV
jgi:SAM-dependent methyltransferase